MPETICLMAHVMYIPRLTIFRRKGNNSFGQELNTLILFNLNFGGFCENFSQNDR